MPRQRALAVPLVVLGLILLVAAVIYFVQPASGLPGFFPGYDPALARHHTTHGIVALLLGAVCIGGGWMLTGRPGQPSSSRSGLLR